MYVFQHKVLHNSHKCAKFDQTKQSKHKIMALEEIKSNELSNELTKRGIENHFSVSNTDYGTSCYFTFYNSASEKYVIRISDHSVSNSFRIFNERHERADKIDIEKTANAIELFLTPEKFEFIPCQIGATHRINGIL